MNLPIVIVSGVLDEDVAVSSMKAGAQDYIMKDNLSRLPAAIDRAIHEASIGRERKRLEEQLRQAQRMEAVGLFAGGIAHDFNNILTAIIGYGSLLRSLMHSEDPLSVYVDQLLSASHKAANLTQSLLTFSRKQVLSVQPVNVNTVIENIGQSLSRTMDEDIELRISPYPKSLQVMAGRGQLEKILLNLAPNSRDLMPDRGQFHMSTQVGRMPGLPGDGGRHGVNKDCVVISLRDTGWGMDETLKSKIFEPLFATKEAGKGTGLGLAVVYGIIKQHNGHIEVDSRPKTGEIFRLYPTVVETHAAQTENRRGEGMAIGGFETILVAEDSDAVRNPVVDILEKAGYRVLYAQDGEEVLKGFMKHEEEIDMVILDAVMPKLSWVLVYREMLARTLCHTP